MFDDLSDKILLETRKMMMGMASDTVLDLIIHIKIETPLRDSRDFVPDPKDNEALKILRDKLRRIKIAEDDGQDVDPVERESLYARVAEVDGRIAKAKADFVKNVREYNRSIVLPIRDAVIRQLREMDGVVAVHREVGETYSGSTIAINAKAFCVNRIASLPDVEMIEDQMRAKGQPGLKYSRPAIKAFDVVRTSGFHGSSAVVGVFDTGVGPALEGQLTIAESRVYTLNDPQPNNTADIKIFEDPDHEGEFFRGHGTAVAGIVRSARPEWTGIAPSCTLLNARIWKLNAAETGFDGIWNDQKVDDASEWVSEYSSADGRCVVNFSNYISNMEAGNPADGGLAADRKVDKRIWDNKVLWVGIVGNAYDMPATVRAPGGALNAVVASAFIDNQQIDPMLFTHWGYNATFYPSMTPRVRKPDVSAPGAQVDTTVTHPAGFDTTEGTSIAAPHVAGTAALMMSVPTFSATSRPKHLVSRAVLINTTDPSRDHVVRNGGGVKIGNTIKPGNWHPNWGWGVLNAEKAVNTTFYHGELVSIGQVSQGVWTRRYIRGMTQEQYGTVTLTWEQRFSGTATVIPLSHLDILVEEYPSGEFIASETSDYEDRNYNTLMIRHFRIPPDLESNTTVQITVIGKFVATGYGPEQFALASTHVLWDTPT